VRRDQRVAGVAAKGEMIGGAVAGVKVGDAGTDGHDLAGGFVSGDERQPRRLVEAGAEIDVDEIQADGMLTEADLARSRRRYVHVLIHQGFRTRHLVHAHGLGHDSLSLGICSGAQLECETKAIAAGLSTRRFKPAIWRPSGGYAWQVH